MRQLVTLPSADKARTLADHLLTLKIDTRLEQQPEGWVVWVCDEDHLPRARQELDEFTRNPGDARYSAAPGIADSLRHLKQQEERDYRRRQEHFNRRMSGPVASQRCTIGLIVLCVLVALLSHGGRDRKIVQALSISTYHRIAENVSVSPGMQPILEGQVWRLVTPILLHFGIWHLLFDMYMLYLLGGVVERQRGALRYLILILILAVSSNLVQYYLGHPVVNGPEIRLNISPNFGGMSGVVYGLFGYIWMKARFQPELGFRIDPGTVTYLIAWFFLCMTGWVGPIANGCHIGGLLTGMLLGYAPTLWSSIRSE